MTRRALWLCVLAILGTSGCNLPPAHGDVNAIIVAADPDLWASVEPQVLEQMEPTIQAVRNETPWRITYQNPNEADWSLLSRFRQVLVIGVRGDEWIEDAIDAAEDPPTEPPAIFQAGDVWSRGQQVSVLLLPETGQAAAVSSLASELQALLDEQFRTYAHMRMFITGEDTELRDSLAANVGFSLLIPQVYSYIATDSVFRFRNDNPSPAELIREVGVTWVSPIPESDPTPEEIRAWRDEFSTAYYNSPQVIDTLIQSYRPVQVEDLRGVEYQAAWQSPPGAWPGGGPFITRSLACPEQDRLYFADAWLYAPNEDKYEYMIQLQTILDSFRCH